jgi:hypothetical protein
LSGDPDDDSDVALYNQIGQVNEKLCISEWIILSSAG